MGKEGPAPTKGSMRDPCDRTVLSLDCGSGHVNVNTLGNYIELNMCAKLAKSE